MTKNAPDSYISPAREEVGEKDPFKLERWSLIHGCVSPEEGNHHLVRAPYYEPTALKLEMDAMIQEQPNIKVIDSLLGHKAYHGRQHYQGCHF